MKRYRILLIAILIVSLPFQVKSQEKEKEKNNTSDLIIIPDLGNWGDLGDLADLGNLNDLEGLSTKLSDLGISIDISKASNQFNQLWNKQSERTQRNPSRTEEKTFDNASKVNIYQNGGNVTIQESDSRKINVTINYFDTKTRKAECDIFMKNGELNIETSESSREAGCYINYLIKLPKGIAVDAKINYANINIDKLQAQYKLSLSYSNAAIASSDKETPNIIIKYGSLKMGNAKDVSIDAMYSKVNMADVNTLNLNGKYNSFVLGKVNTIRFANQSMYNKYQIESINNLTASIKYDNINLGELIQNIDLKAAYSKINIGKVSSKSKSIVVNGSYSTVNLSLNESISASVEANIKYGDLFVSKKYNTKTISDESDSFSVSKKVVIGSSSPSLTVKVSNSYSNVNIK